MTCKQLRDRYRIKYYHKIEIAQFTNTPPPLPTVSSWVLPSPKKHKYTQLTYITCILNNSFHRKSNCIAFYRNSTTGSNPNPQPRVAIIGAAEAAALLAAPEINDKNPVLL